MTDTVAAKQDLELSELIRFWDHPCQYFIQKRLGFRLGDAAQCLAADEPFSLNAREQYPIKQELLADKLGFAAAGSPEAFAARGTLPPGAIGELQLRSFAAEVERFAGVVQSHLGAGEKKEAREIKLLLGEFTLSGRLGSLYGPGILHFRCAQLNPKDQMRAWIEHLAFCASDANEQRESILIGTDAVVTYEHVDDAAGQLNLLCRRFVEGQTGPLPFFGASALAYAGAEFTGRKDPLRQAQQKWHGGWNRPGENKDRYIVCCFGANAPLSEQFVAVAREVCLPLVSHARSVASG